MATNARSRTTRSACSSSPRPPGHARQHRKRRFAGEHDHVGLHGDVDEPVVQQKVPVLPGAGFGLADIRSMLSAGTAAVRHEVTARHYAVLRERIARAQAALAMIEEG